MTKAEITKALRGFIAKHTEAGSRLVLYADGFIEVEIVCDGRDTMMGYYCCLSPGHNGMCFSKHKKVDFDRE